ncbi:hypothetical protein SCALM49S_04210 [Streptomyces californicus]
MHRDETAGTATTTDVIRADAPPAIDRGRFPDAVTPWEDPVWRADALAWIAENLAAHGLAETAPRSVRLRPWSVLVRLTVAGTGPVWFKAVPPAAAFEAGLTDALARWVPDHVLTPLAVEVERGWILTPDGGPVLGIELRGLPAQAVARGSHWSALRHQRGEDPRHDELDAERGRRRRLRTDRVPVAQAGDAAGFEYTDAYLTPEQVREHTEAAVIKH